MPRSPDPAPWSAPPADLTLAPDEVHVWRVFLDKLGAQLKRFRRTLSAAEIARAERYHFRKHADWFVARRGAMRATLAAYLGTVPEKVSFQLGAHGKPALGGSHRKADLRFNLSDSNGLGLLAVTRGRELGVDLECIREGPLHDKIAQRFFAPKEVEALEALPQGERPGAFFRCWTRKEAYIKARGEGLSLRLDGFEVSLAPGRPAALLRSDDGPHEALRWTLQNLEPAPGFAGCLTVEKPIGRIRCWDWQA